MKILYAFQGTGNGHLARAQEIVPILKKFATVETLISGHQSQLEADFTIDKQFKGISLLYNKIGGLSYFKTFTENSFYKAFKDISNLQLQNYDLIINDFEPLTAWATKGSSFPVIEVSHQASMLFEGTPKPKNKNFFGEMVLKYYASCESKIGFHFDTYHPQIRKPVIRKKIRNLNPLKKGHYVVYLPSFSDENLLNILKEIPVSWKIFSKYSKIKATFGNVEIFPIDEVQFLHYFESCTGILCNAGFELPAEALFLGKKLFVLPIHSQYEQECNAAALHEMGVLTAKKLSSNDLLYWVASEDFIQVNYTDDTENIIVNDILKFAR